MPKPLTEEEIVQGLLQAKVNDDLPEARRLHALRHELIDREAANDHKRIDRAFKRWFNASPVAPKPHGHGKTSENEDLCGIKKCLCGESFGDWNDYDAHIERTKDEK
jgi:hypothetical protein